MQGEVTVPYSAISGENISTYGNENPPIIGSTGQPSSEYTMFIIMWSLPGGIINVTQNGQNFWGYAVNSRSSGGDYSYDSTIYRWLQGLEPSARCQPDHTFSSVEDINNPDNAEIVKENVNKLLKAYAKVLGNFNESSDLEEFENKFPNCYFFG